MKKHFPYLLIIAFVAIFFTLLIPRNLYKHDLVFHYHQIEDLRIRLEENVFHPSPISKSLANGYGYGASLFYPPLMHFLTAITGNLLSVDTFFAIDLISILCFILSGMAMYFLSYKLFGHQKVALLASFLYLFFPYHIVDIWSRGAYAECFVFLFLPLVISGLIDLVRGNTSKFYILFVVGYVGGVYSHYLSMFFLSFLLLPFFIIYRHEIFKKERIKALLIACSFVLLLILPLIVPILEHHLALDYRVFALNIMASKKSIGATTLGILDYFFTSKTGYSNGLPVYVDYITWLFIILCLCSFKKLKKQGGSWWMWLFYTIFFTIFCLSFKPLWTNTPTFFRTLQFVWRLEIMLAISMSLFASYYIVLWNNKVSNLLLGIILIIFFITGRGTSIGQGLYTTHEEIIEKIEYGVGRQAEYLPQKTKFSYLWEREKGISADQEVPIEILQDDTPYLKFSVETENCVVLELPRIYYLGYTLKDEENHSIPLQVSNHGFLQAEIEESGTYTLVYQGTFAMRLSSAIRFLSLLAFFLFISWKNHILKRIYPFFAKKVFRRK